jgi:putative ABC transport system permease protein
VEPEFAELRTLPIGEGRFISTQDERGAERVCIIGEDVKKQLFGTRPDVAGRTIALNSLPFRVIGVLAKKDQNSSYSALDEKKVFVPYSTMSRDFPPKKYYEPGYLDEILYRPSSEEDWEEAQMQVRKVLARDHDYDPRDRNAIGIWDTVEDQQQVAAIFDSMTIFLAFIALVTLSLGGIGVMNIMLVTVSERTREIGLRKALGATRLRIMTDFLVEGCVLAFASGAVGWTVAFGLSALLKIVPMPVLFPGLPVSGVTTAWAFTAISIIAITSAMFPAWKAASLTPVEALRYER